jgi:predicted Zn-dependent protease
VIFLVLAAVFAATQLTERVLGPATPGESDLAQVPDLSPARTLSGTKVYLVPMGRLDAVDPQRLSQHLEDTYRIETEILPVLALPGIAFDPDRDQLKADTLLVTLARRYPVAGSQTVVIGLTDFDTFRSLDPSLRYVFSTRARSGYAVVSAARMGPGLLERVLRRDSTEERMRKMVERNVGLLFYHLQLRPDPSSLLRDEIMSVDDIDEMQGGLSFAPYPPS